jgi:hypothetical protein
LERLNRTGGVLDRDRCGWESVRGFWSDSTSRYPIIYWLLSFAGGKRLYAKTGQLFE